jgi:FO synthase subunit 1
MEQGEVEKTLRNGAALGCTEALFTFGERPEQEPGFPERIRAAGYTTILDYCEAMCKKSIEYGILPHTNAGILTYEEMERLRPVNASMGLMLETTAEIPAHATSPGKSPDIRLAMMEDAGKLKIPFTTGLLLGIGETMADREDSLFAIRDLHPSPAPRSRTSPPQQPMRSAPRSGWQRISSSRRSPSRSHRT